ncbi:hypothetical protein E2C11_29620 [Streptomyces lavendulae]|nr:hypothetical protein E2C11_29620 [Streptomyces lavendulae]
MNTLKSGTIGGIVRSFTASSLCLFQRNHVPVVMTGDGVSTYLALTFGTLLSSQGTVASFVLTLSGFPPGFPSCFRLYQILSAPIPGRRVCLGVFGFRLGPFDIHYFSAFPAGLIIESLGFEFGHANATKTTPVKGLD